MFKSYRSRKEEVGVQHLNSHNVMGGDATENAFLPITGFLPRCACRSLRSPAARSVQIKALGRAAMAAVATKTIVRGKHPVFPCTGFACSSYAEPPVTTRTLHEGRVFKTLVIMTTSLIEGRFKRTHSNTYTRATKEFRCCGI